MYRAFSYRSVPVYVHWSALGVFAWAMLAGLLVNPGMLLVAPGSLLLMAVHELGHLEIARRRGHRGIRIDIYPWLGLCHVDAPENRRDDLEIAWGGVLAQAPLLLLAVAVEPLRDTIPALGSVSFVFGYLNTLMILFNLLPIAPLDGHKAWRLVPLLLRR